MAEAGFIEAFQLELEGLRDADKSKINMLSMLAEDNKTYAGGIVKTIEQHIKKCPPPARLPALYLVDSIIKNVREPYKSLFSKHLDQVFGEVWRTAMPDMRTRLARLCDTWNGVLAADLVARVRSCMVANGASHAQVVPTTQVQLPVHAVQQPQQPGMGFQHAQHPPGVQQQHVLPPQQPQQHIFQQPHVVVSAPQPRAQLLFQGVLPAGAQIVGGVGGVVSIQPAAPPQPQPQPLFVVGPNGQLVPVAQPVHQPQIIAAPAPQPVPAPAMPPHMLAGLPPVSPAHPNWPQQQQLQPPPPPRPMQQQPVPAGVAPMVRRSPAYPASPAVVQASPHHRPGSSPAHHSAPNSTQRSGSPAVQAEQLTASLDILLQGLTKGNYLNDLALKTTSFDPAFLKKEHRGVVAQLKEESEKTRARFKDIQYQRNKRRKDAKSSSTHSRGWYLSVESWVQATTVGGSSAAEEDVVEEQVSEDEGPAPVPTVPEDPSQTHCAISHEPFDKVFDDDTQGWVYKGVMRLQGEQAERYGVPDNSLVKVECLAEADLGSSPAALAAAAAGGVAAVGGEEEADLAAAAAAAPAAGQQQQQEQQQQQQQPEVPVHVKLEQQLEPAQAEDGPVAMKVDVDDAAAAAVVKQDSPTEAFSSGSEHQQGLAAAAAAGGIKREAGSSDQLLQQQQGTPTKKQRVAT